MWTNVVRDGYDQIARVYLADRNRLGSGKYVQKLLKLLPKHSTVLDLGCGAGVPIDDVLLKAGHEVIGIDISNEQIKLARAYCPRGRYIVGDIADLEEGTYQVDAVISFYTLFHIPRTEQAKALKIIASFLPKGGMLLLTMGDREFEGSHILHSVPMWVSQYGTIKNKMLVEKAGFKIVFSEMDSSGGEHHQILMAEKV